MAITPTPSYTPMPATPQRLTDTPDEFIAKSDPWADAIAIQGPELSAIGMAAELNAQAAEAAATTAEAAADAAVGISGYFGTTTATLNVAPGSQNFTIAQAGLSFAANQQVVLILLSDETVRLTGSLTSYTAGSGAAQMNVTRFSGSVASGSGWAMILKALEAISPERALAQAAAFALVL